jgi:hypothetical protein
MQALHKNSQRADSVYLSDSETAWGKLTIIGDASLLAARAVRGLGGLYGRPLLHMSQMVRLLARVARVARVVAKCGTFCKVCHSPLKFLDRNRPLST